MKTNRDTSVLLIILAFCFLVIFPVALICSDGPRNQPGSEFLGWVVIEKYCILDQEAEESTSAIEGTNTYKTRIFWRFVIQKEIDGRKVKKDISVTKEIYEKRPIGDALTMEDQVSLSRK